MWELAMADGDAGLRVPRPDVRRSHRGQLESEYREKDEALPESKYREIPMQRTPQCSAHSALPTLTSSSSGCAWERLAARGWGAPNVASFRYLPHGIALRRTRMRSQLLFGFALILLGPVFFDHVVVLLMEDREHLLFPPLPFVEGGIDTVQLIGEAVASVEINEPRPVLLAATSLGFAAAKCIAHLLIVHVLHVIGLPRDVCAKVGKRHRTANHQASALQASSTVNILIPSMPGIPFILPRRSSMSSLGSLAAGAGSASLIASLIGVSLFASAISTSCDFSAQPSHLRLRRMVESHYLITPAWSYVSWST
uniref:Uncharacterized protein n=1 Tax=Haptolina ericina TaxID=156174 RepID=A0A7S3ALR8_9EUKA|mmetsp:Transcript_25247/g.57503  ORF Transcript_25247/g.57503 Transcript_25247/m.57503 type:complete len:311 (+) Transcript_25247:72-1004(+)